MLTAYDFITILILLSALFLLFFFLQYSRIRSNNFHYVYSLLLITIAFSVTELLITIGFLETAKFIFPLYISLSFLVYPLFFLYTKRLVYTERELRGEKTIMYYLLPIFIFLVTIPFYLTASPSDKLKVILWQYDTIAANSTFGIFLPLVVVFYYIQFLIYVVLFIKLYLSAKENMSDRIIDKNVVLTWLKYFIGMIILYEVSTILFIYIFPFAGFDAAIQLSSLIFLVFLGILRINQSTIEIQTRLRKAKLNLADIHETKKQYIIEPGERTELMQLIKDTLKEKKLFTDPNLTIEKFSKKVHTSARKLSIVINEITGENFSYLLNKYRIDDAVKLLMKSEDNFDVENIYLKTGFNSRSTFYRVFKEHTGLSPKEYKIKHN